MHVDAFPVVLDSPPVFAQPKAINAFGLKSCFLLSQDFRSLLSYVDFQEFLSFRIV